MSLLASVRPITLVPSGIWTLDPTRSTVAFNVRHLKLTKVHGRFRNVRGLLRSDGESSVSIAGSIDVSSIDTGDERRDARLRGAGFFDLEGHPTIDVRLAAAPAYSWESLSVRGTMTIRGVERPIELHLEGRPASLDGSEDIRLRACGSVSRRAFGLDWDPAFAAGGLVIDDRVTLSLDIVVTPF